MDDPSIIIVRRSRDAWMWWLIVLLSVLSLSAGVVAYFWFTSNSQPQREGDEATVQPSARSKPYKETRPVPATRFQDSSGRQLTLADFKGRVVLLNIWATWCSPCRKEMPTLDRLQAALGGPSFEVVALSIDRDGMGIVRSFYDEIHVQSLAVYIDPSAEAMQTLSIIGVPTTILIDASGREVWRRLGPETWDAPDMVAMLRETIAQATPPSK
ncbi:MAG TPA: TlpA disulfide reductase family protein [Casimicrobiaceae bacterium]|jgi:thiol-disulfide isomerase/thioredoxin|nr:TlpA disulfide reductase family protein [Casimicrobiaceae bacterium]